MLTASATANESDDPVTFLWERSSNGIWTPIPGATGNTYTTAAADLGDPLRVEATATNENGLTAVEDSAATGAVPPPPPPPLQVSIPGTAQEGQTLTASANQDGVTFRWLSSSDGGNSWTPIPNAAGASYTVQESDEGHSLEAEGTAQSAAVADSNTTSAVTDMAPGLSVPTIDDTTPQQGDVLTASATANESDDPVTYQWQRLSNGTWALIPGATGNTYTTAVADRGDPLRVEATATNENGLTAVEDSAATGAVPPPPPPPPPPQLTVSITGTAQEGQVLTANANESNVAFRWQSSGDGATWNNIKGATSSSYSVGEADEGDELRAVALSGGSTAHSDPSATVIDVVPTLSVSISGTPEEGQTLTASAEANDADASVAYQWQESSDRGSTWNNIAGATASTYTAAFGDGGDLLRVAATSTDDDGLGTTATSASAGPVTFPNPLTLPPNAFYADTQSNQTIVGGGGTTSVGLQSTGSVFRGDVGSDSVTVTGSNNTVIGAGGNATVDATAGSVLILGGSGPLLLDGSAGAATVQGGTGPITVAGGASASLLVFNNAAPLFFTGGSGAGTVVGGSGAETIFANGGGQFWGGSGDMLFVGGSGASTAAGGSGTSTLFGGSSGRDVLVAGTGPSTLVGVGSGNQLVGIGTNPDVLISGGGSETLVGSAGGGSDVMYANTGDDALFGGSGNDIFVAAGGNTQMIAGSGADLFVFSNGNAGGSAVIWNFARGQDHVGLYGYGPHVVRSVLKSAVVDSGSTTITLRDNTQITFADVSHVSARDFVS